MRNIRKTFLGDKVVANDDVTLKIKKGDSVFLTETSEGYVVTPYDPEFEKQMAVAREGMAEYRNALRELAK